MPRLRPEMFAMTVQYSTTPLWLNVRNDIKLLPQRLVRRDVKLLISLSLLLFVGLSKILSVHNDNDLSSPRHDGQSRFLVDFSSPK